MPIKFWHTLKFILPHEETVFLETEPGRLPPTRQDEVGMTAFALAGITS